MALAKQHVEYLLGVAGIDERTDPKVVPMPKLLDLLNGDLSTPGRIKKRNGYIFFDPGVVAASGSFDALAKYNGNMVGIRSLGYSGEYLPRGGKWSGYYNPTVATSDSRTVITDKQYEYSRGDAVYSSGYIFVAVNKHQDNISGGALPHYAEMWVFDVETLSAAGHWSIYSDASNPTHVKLAVVDDDTYDNPTVIAFYIDGTNVKAQTMWAENPGAGMGSAATIYTDVHPTCKYFDVHYDGDKRAYMTYINYVGENAGVKTFSAKSINEVVSAVNTDTITTNDTMKAVCVYRHETQAYIEVGYAGATIGVKHMMYTPLIAQQVGGTVDGTFTDCRNMVAGSFGTGYFALYYEDDSAADKDAYIKWRTIAITAGTLGTAGTAYGVSLAHKALEAGYGYYKTDDHISAIGLYKYVDQSLEALYYTARLDQEDTLVPIAKYNCGAASNAGAAYRPLANCVAGIADRGIKRFWPAAVELALSATGGTIGIYQNQSIAINSYEENPLLSFNTCEHANLLFMAQGLPLVWDGQRPQELGFSHPPLIYSVATAGAGNMAAGDYNYIAVFEWQDATGQIHRSRPSLPVLFTAGASDSATIVVAQPVRILGGGCHVAVYRTEVGPGSVYYRVNPHEMHDGYASHFCGSGYTFVDDQADATIATHEVLYTTGGVLENYAPPPCKYACEHQDRLWVIHAETGALWASKEFVTGEAPAFNPVLTVPTGMEIDPPVAIASMERGLVVLWSDRVGVVYGEGPNDRGEGGSWTQPIMLPTSVGCRNAKSVVNTPVGLIYDTPLGLYVLGPDLQQPQFIGGEVVDLVDKTIRSADVMTERHEVRFVTQDGYDYVYDYLLKQWHRHDLTHLAADNGGTQLVAALVYDNDHYVMNDKNVIWRQRVEYWVDQIAGEGTTYEYYDLIVETAWLKMNGLVGFMRAWQAWILGTYETAHSGEIEIYYDYNDDSYDEIEIIPYELYTDAPYLKRFRIIQQRCQAIKFKITISAGVGADWDETQPAGAANKGWSTVCADADMSRALAGIEGTRIYLLSGGGGWAEVQPTGGADDRQWKCSAMSSTGQYQMAGCKDTNGRLYNSDDSGASWTERKPAGDIDQEWYWCGMSSDGQYQYAVVKGGRCWASSDYGVTWAEIYPTGTAENKNWRCGSVDSTGRYLTIGAGSGRLYTSDNYGAAGSWTERQPAGAVDKWWFACASDATGRYRQAAGSSICYISDDYGETWVSVSTAYNVYGCAMSSDGKVRILVDYGGRVYRSRSYGLPGTWTEEQPAGDYNRNWACCASDATGEYNLAAISNGRIYWTEYSYLDGLGATLSGLRLQYGVKPNSLRDRGLPA